MSLLMLSEDFLCTFVLLVDHTQHLVIHNLGGRLRIWFLELILSIIVVAEVGQFITHACKGDHAVSLLCGTLKVVHCSCGDLTDEQFLRSTASEQ